MTRSLSALRRSVVTSVVLVALSTAAWAIVQTIPVHISAPSSASGSSSFTVTVTTQQANSEAGAVLVGTNRGDILTSPSGSWPYTLVVPANATSVSFTVNTASVGSSQSTQLRTCKTDEDITNPLDWRSTADVTINP